MKRILLSPRLSKIQGYDEIRDELDVNWATFIESCGFIPVIASTKANKKIYFDDLKCEGVILTGGNDVSSVSNDELSLLRDKSEGDILREALKKNIPVLGVCRGMQFIGQQYGASIIKRDGHVRVMHELTFQNDQPLFKAYGKSKVVNSFHGYEVKLNKGDLIQTATAPDGSTEALVHTKLKIAGIMWHPERVAPFDAQDKALVQNFFK